MWQEKARASNHPAEFGYWAAKAILYLGQEGLSLGIQTGEPVSLLGLLQDPSGKNQAFLGKGTCSNQHGQNFISNTQRPNLFCCLHQMMNIRFLEVWASVDIAFFHIWSGHAAIEKQMVKGDFHIAVCIDNVNQSQKEVKALRKQLLGRSSKQRC